MDRIDVWNFLARGGLGEYCRRRLAVFGRAKFHGRKFSSLRGQLNMIRLSWGSFFLLLECAIAML